MSLMYKNIGYEIEDINALAEQMKSKKIISTDNFLEPIMHEWMHVAHLNYLYKICGLNEAQVKNIINKLSRIQFGSIEKQMIEEHLGEYVYNGGQINGSEVVAEGLTKLITMCLDKNQIKFTDKFDDSCEKMPKEFIELLRCLIYYPVL